MSEKKIKKPELLAPAGSTQALDAAIAGGADAVYFGASAFNARMNAENFGHEEIKRAIEKCRNFGVRSNITFNTLVYDRELSSALDEIKFLYECGADALIIADLGLAMEVKHRFPDIELHASTQMSIHNTLGARFLAERGFDRVVIARELDRDMIKQICESSPIDTEIFIHGALCVSHSGQCLFSSLVGGRSGNRGECAQPCRLPYSGSYPLSLKDNCLASCFDDLLSLGAASLKIEGRMKSPAYVYGVTSVYRRLIDEGRAATCDELDELASLFSRSGFTDGYYKRSITPLMNGIRTESDKAMSKNEACFDIKARRRMLEAKAVFKLGEPSALTLTLDVGAEKISATAYGDIPVSAVNAPLSVEAVKKNLLKFGSSDFVCNDAEIELEDGIILPVSKINALRRDAVAALEEKLMPRRRIIEDEVRAPEYWGQYASKRSARFLNSAQISEIARDFFDIIYLPLEAYDKNANGVILPPVIFDREIKRVREMLDSAKKQGAVHALVCNLGQIALAKEYGFICHGDFRLNASNKLSVEKLIDAGLVDVIPSPELTLARLAALGERASCNTIIYGRIPMMLLEKCVIKQTSGCDKCKLGHGVLTDRMGEKFPVYRTFEHRNIVYNSRVTYMADKKDELENANIHGGHFIFTDENSHAVDSIIGAYKNSLPHVGGIRRISKR